MTMGSRSTLPTAADSAMTAFSALHLLRSYNHLLTPGSSLASSYPHYLATPGPTEAPRAPRAPRELTHPPSLPPTRFDLPLLGAFQPYSPFSLPAPQLALEPKPVSRGSTPNLCGRRPRGEKKPIPEEQKDDRYYERRKRNNQAAKKSRDARKIREDQIALRATLLEHENAVLRAQILTLREEAQSLRQLLVLQRRDDREEEDKGGDKLT